MTYNLEKIHRMLTVRFKVVLSTTRRIKIKNNYDDCLTDYEYYCYLYHFMSMSCHRITNTIIINTKKKLPKKKEKAIYIKKVKKKIFI